MSTGGYRYVIFDNTLTGVACTDAVVISTALVHNVQQIMARLSDKQYVGTYRQLHRLWLDQSGLFSMLSPTEQWYLHDYFQLCEDWSSQQLLAHRREISVQRPSLPQQAGRALTKFHTAAAQWAVRRVRIPSTRPVPGTSRKHVDRRLSVRPLVRPEIDYDKFAELLLELARQQLAERPANGGDTNADMAA